VTFSAHPASVGPIWKRLFRTTKSPLTGKKIVEFEGQRHEFVVREEFRSH